MISEYMEARVALGLPVLVPCINPEITLLEKIFLLHEEFQKPQAKIRVDRLSRHIYDIHQLAQTEFLDLALSSQELYVSIVKHREQFTAIREVDYSLHNPSTINPIPPTNILKDWEHDYKAMLTEMIYGEHKPSFEEILETLKQIQMRLRATGDLVL